VAAEAAASNWFEFVSVRKANSGSRKAMRGSIVMIETQCIVVRMKLLD
jgi:hypothetical protein